MVTILRRNVPVVCGASYHLLGYRISQDSKIRFQLQVESYISDWLFSKSRLLASYVSHHKAMAYDKVPLEVLHDSGTALFTMGMYLLDPFFKKRRSPLEPVSRRTLIVLCLTISLLLASSSGGWASFRCFLDQFRPNFFKLDPILVFLAHFLALVVIELFLSLPYKCITMTTAVTLPVLAISIAFLSALLLLIGIWSVTLIGRG